MGVLELLHISSISRRVAEGKVDQRAEVMSKGVSELEAALHGSLFENHHMDPATIVRIARIRAALALGKVKENPSEELITRRNQ